MGHTRKRRCGEQRRNYYRRMAKQGTSKSEGQNRYYERQVSRAERQLARHLEARDASRP